jgi:anaerobic selenocysteine-containing dehydrogenase
MNKLELLVHIDIKMSATARLADYVIAPKVSFEVPTMSMAAERIEDYSVHWGMSEPFGMYAPALMEPPVGSDLIEEWEFFYGVAQRMGLVLFNVSFGSKTATLRETREFRSLDMKNKPSTDELFELLSSNSRIPLSEVKRNPDGALFPEVIVAAAKSPTCTARLDVGNTDMMEELAAVHDENSEVAGYPYRLISRRMKNAYNSSLRDLQRLIKKDRPYNPAYMHPCDLAGLNLIEGDLVKIRSPHGEIDCIVSADKDLKPGLLSMAHAYGGLPDDVGREVTFQQGSNTSRLISVEDSYDRFSGIPRMSAVPVAIAKVD